MKPKKRINLTRELTSLDRKRVNLEARIIGLENRIETLKLTHLNMCTRIGEIIDELEKM